MFAKFGYIKWKNPPTDSCKIHEFVFFGDASAVSVGSAAHVEQHEVVAAGPVEVLHGVVRVDRLVLRAEEDVVPA